MSTLFCIFLGIFIGLSDFLPLSGLGHLDVLCNLFDINPLSGDGMFISFLFSFSGIVVLCVMFWGELSQMINDTANRFMGNPIDENGDKRSVAGYKLLTLLATSLLVYIISFTLVGKKVFSLYNNIVYIGCMFIISGVLLFFSDRMSTGNKKIKSMNYADALIIGLAAGASVFPGLSRIGLIYATGIALGIKKDFSGIYSCLLSLPIFLLNCISSLAKSINSGFTKEYVPLYLLGTVFAIISGIAAVNIFRSISKNGNMKVFSYYSWVAGLLFIILAVIF